MWGGNRNEKGGAARRPYKFLLRILISALHPFSKHSPKGWFQQQSDTDDESDDD